MRSALPPSSQNQSVEVVLTSLSLLEHFLVNTEQTGMKKVLCIWCWRYTWVQYLNRSVLVKSLYFWGFFSCLPRFFCCEIFDHVICPLAAGWSSGEDGESMKQLRNGTACSVVGDSPAERCWTWHEARGGAGSFPQMP